MNEDRRAALRPLVVVLLAELRAEYLAAGASPLQHWDQIQDRLRIAARTCETAPQWATRLSNLLGLGAPGRRRSSATIDLVSAVGSEHSAFLCFVEEEAALLMAMAMAEAGRRRSEREQRLREEYVLPEEGAE